MSAPSSMWTTNPPCRCHSSYPVETPVPASERPTERAIPRAPRVPRFYGTNSGFGRGEFTRPVEEVRYDLAECTCGAELYTTPRVRTLAKDAERANRYAGLTRAEVESMHHAIDALIDRAPDLGARFIRYDE